MRLLYIAFTQPAFESDGSFLPWARDLYARYERIGRLSKTVTLTFDPEIADYILFVDCHVVGNKGYADRIRASDLFDLYREKIYVYDQTDNPRLGLPGLYVSMPKQLFDAKYMRSVPYFHYEIDKIDFLDGMSSAKSQYATLIGDASTSPVRRNLFKAQTDCVNKTDTSNIGFHDYSDTRPSEQELTNHLVRYCENIRSAKFSICPRGFGTSSFRLYESIMLGTIPVVLSDDFVPPTALSALSSYICIPERDISLICQKLERASAQESQLQTHCNDILMSVLKIDQRLDYMISEIDRLATHNCHFYESVFDRLRHKIYWLSRKYRNA
jgi:hypothetical protein